MAKHSHWSNIKHQKAANDRKKAAMLAKTGRLIAVAVQMGGASVDDNPRLRLAVEKARAAHLPLEAIERAIKRASGEGGEGRQMTALVYEGYAPGGVAIVLDILTDNRNRTAPEIKKIFERCGGSLGNPGCVAWQFKDKALFLVENAQEEQVMEILLAADCDAEDLAQEEGGVSVVADPGQYDRIGKALVAAKLTVASAELTKLPETRVEVADAGKAAQVRELLEELDEHDDVQSVYHNGDL